MGLQYPKNSQIFLCVLPQHSFCHALEKGDDNWIGRCLNLRLSFGCTPVESLSAELQPFYGHLRFCEVASDFVDSIQVGFEMDFPIFSTVFLRFPFSAFPSTTNLRLRLCSLKEAKYFPVSGGGNRHDSFKISVTMQAGFYHPFVAD